MITRKGTEENADGSSCCSVRRRFGSLLRRLLYCRLERSEQTGMRGRLGSSQFSCQVAELCPTSMRLLNHIWYTFIGLLLVSVVFAMSSPSIATGFFQLWPSIIVSSIVGAIVGRRGAIAAGLAGAFFLGPLVLPIPRVCFAPPLYWQDQLIEDFSIFGRCFLVGSIISLTMWTIGMMVLPRRPQKEVSSIVGSSTEVHPFTGVVTKHPLGTEGAVVNCNE